jgi:hypothetical protein
VYRAYHARKKSDTAESTEFESWASEVTEATWDSDSDDQAEDKIIRLFQQPIAVGMDGVDALAVINSINDLQSEDLELAIKKLARAQGPDADVRTTIIGWLMSNGERALAQNLLQMLQQQNANAQPTPQQSIGTNTVDQTVVSEDLGSLRKLAGLVKNN